MGGCIGYSIYIMLKDTPYACIMNTQNIFRDFRPEIPFERPKQKCTRTRGCPNLWGIAFGPQDQPIKFNNFARYFEPLVTATAMEDQVLFSLTEKTDEVKRSFIFEIDQNDGKNMRVELFIRVL